MRVLTNLGRAARALVGRGESRAINGSGYVPAAPILSGTYITPQTALGLTSVFAAINVIARDYASLPVEVYRRLKGGGLEVAEGHPLRPILRTTPDGEMDAFRFRRDQMGHVQGWGNGYAEIDRDPRDGRVTGLHLCHPAKTKAKRTQANRLYYELDGQDDRRVLPENMLHLAGLGFNGIEGYSPVTVARQSIGLAVAVEQFGAAFFGNGAIPSGKIKLKKKLKEEALNNLRRSLNQVHQGPSSAHQTMILEEDMDWEATSIPPEEAQFLATRQFSVVEVARLFGVPPHKLGDYTNGQLANVEESNLDYIVTTLAGWVAMIEAQWNWKLLTAQDREQYVILHDFTSLMRGNSSARVAYYNGLRNMGVLSADDIRKAEGLNPLGPDKGGDAYLVQSQYTPLANAGKPKFATAGATSTPSVGADVADVQATALNGAQITSLLQIVQQVAAGTLPGDAASGMIAAAFPTLDATAIAAILGPLAGFTPQLPPAAAA